jgi:uncharacterized protein YjiS (DUF1127 family)
MLMQNAPKQSRGDAYTALARQYPSVVLIVDACFNACSAIAHAWRLRRTRRILERLDRDRLRDIGLARDDLRNGSLDHSLRRQAAASQPDGPWAHAWSWLLKADRSRKSLAALGDDQLCNLSERGLKVRRDALHDHRTACAGRTTGARR